MANKESKPVFSQERLDQHFQTYENLKKKLELDKREPNEKEKVFLNVIEDIFCLKYTL